MKAFLKLLLFGLILAEYGCGVDGGSHFDQPQARIQAEINNLDSAMKAYREKHGEYPPSDLTDVTNPSGPVAEHLRKAFPKCKLLKANASDMPGELDAIAMLQNGESPLSPAQALVFWLSGFSNDPIHPITGRLPIGHDGKISVAGFNWTVDPPNTLMNFDKKRLIVNAATGSHVPVYGPRPELTAPYVYFAARNYAAHWQANFQFPNADGPPGSAWTGQGGRGTGRPYLQDNGNASAFKILGFANPKSFQIISAGLDDDYDGNFDGVVAQTGATHPSGVGGSATLGPLTTPFYPYTRGDKDNLTNFSGGRNLGDSMP